MFSLAYPSVLQQFQQHDVQELNRILFTAIESSLVGTSGKDIINKLYHGRLANKVRLHYLYIVGRLHHNSLKITLSLNSRLTAVDCIRSGLTSLRLTLSFNSRLLAVDCMKQV